MGSQCSSLFLSSLLLGVFVNGVGNTKNNRTNALHMMQWYLCTRQSWGQEEIFP